MNKSKKITDGALLTSAYIVLLLVTAFIPLLGTFTFFALPIPFAIYAAKHHWQSAVIMFLAAGLLSSIFATIFSLPMTLLAGFGGIMLGTAMYQKRTAYETWARGAIGFVIGLIGVFLIIQLAFNINIYDEIDMVMEEAINLSQSIFNQMGLEEAGEEQLTLLEEQMMLFKDILPGLMAMISIGMAFIAQWLSYKIMNRLERTTFTFPPFKSLNLPISLFWIYFTVMIASFFVTDQESGLYIVIINAVILAMILLTIQGFSFVFFYADHKNMSKAIPIAVVIISFIIPGIFLLLIRILGIIDLGFSLKERIASKEN